MKRSYAETFFRHRLLLTAPVLIAFVLAAAYGLQQPRNYVASATIWTDRRIPGDSTIGTSPSSDAPSGGQAALLASLLATRAFMYAVVKDSPLADQLRGPQLEVDLALGRLAASVTVATPGPQVLAIAVKQRVPEHATGLAAAMVRQFIKEEQRRIRSRAKAEMTYDKQQLSTAARSVRAAEAALMAYTRSHPGAASATAPRQQGQPGQVGQADSAETTLVGALALAQQNYSDAAKAYNESTAAYTQTTNAALEMLDPPDQAYPQARKKVVLFSAVGGLLAGLSISVLTLLLLVTRDRAVREEVDLQQALGLRVVGTIGELSRRRRLPFSGKRPDTPVITPNVSS